MFLLTLWLCALVLAICIAWCTLKPINFGMAAWYPLLNITEKVKEYGPHNRYRFAFERTTQEEQYRIYSQIVTAIHNKGKGLNEIIYHLEDGTPVDYFLTNPEALHLKDVSTFISLGKKIGFAHLIIFISGLGYLYFYPIKFPSFKKQCLIATLGITIVITAAVLIGPQTVFYELHNQFFPKDHPWFFYYEDSLMTLLMYAPYSFAYIASALGVITFLIIILLLFSLSMINKVKLGVAV